MTARTRRVAFERSHRVRTAITGMHTATDGQYGPNAWERTPAARSKLLARTWRRRIRAASLPLPSRLRQSTEELETRARVRISAPSCIRHSEKDAQETSSLSGPKGGFKFATPHGDRTNVPTLHI